MKYFIFLLSISSLTCISICSFGQIPSNEAQIATAMLAAPDNMKKNATVLGYDKDGKLVTLKKGSNDMICLADDPEKKGFNVACYQKELEPFMARGRELRAEGKSQGEIFEIRGEEIKSGLLAIPKGATLNIFYATEEQYDKEAGKVEGGNKRYVVYLPYATAETTGLPLKPEMPGGPWLMEPGTHRAHIMITPELKNN